MLYTDACGAGHLGAVLFVDGERRDVHTHVPQWFMDAGAGIFELELLAELMGLTLACEVAPGRPVLLCCDNSGASATVVRGACKTALGGMAASVFWVVAAQFRCPVWVEGVAPPTTRLTTHRGYAQFCRMGTASRGCFTLGESRKLSSRYVRAETR